MQAWCALKTALATALAGAGTVAITGLRAGGVLVGAPPLSCARLLAEVAPAIKRSQGRGLQGSSSMGVLVFATAEGLDATQIRLRLRATFDTPSIVDSALAASARAACAAFNVALCPSASASISLAILPEPVVVAYVEDITDNSPANAATASAGSGLLASTSTLGIGIGVGAGAMLMLALVAFLVTRRRTSSIASTDAKQPFGDVGATTHDHQFHTGTGPQGGSFALANPMAQVHVADHAKSAAGQGSSPAVLLRATGVSARQPPKSSRRLVLPSEDPSVPRGWQTKPDGTFVSPNGNPHASLPANTWALYQGLGPEWEIDFDQGDAYYINTSDGTTHWDRPGSGGYVNPMHK